MTPAAPLGSKHSAPAVNPEGRGRPAIPSPKGRLTAFLEVVTINWYADNFSKKDQRKSKNKSRQGGNRYLNQEVSNQKVFQGGNQ